MMSDYFRDTYYKLVEEAQEQREHERRQERLKQLDAEYAREEAERKEALAIIDFEPPQITGGHVKDGLLANRRANESSATQAGKQGKLNKPRKDNKQKQRQDNLTKAILVACRSFGSKPPFEELWKFFQDDKDKTGFIADCTDTHLTWQTTKGKLKDTQKESVANRLSRLNYP